MSKTLPVYLIAAAVAAVALFAGLTGMKILFIKDARIAAITVAAAGFVMCATGMIQFYVTKAPVHVLAILGYVFGLVALFAGIVQVFSLNVPVLSEPKTTLILLAALIAAKVIIGRLSFLVKV